MIADYSSKTPENLDVYADMPHLRAKGCILKRALLLLRRSNRRQ